MASSNRGKSLNNNFITNNIKLEETKETIISKNPIYDNIEYKNNNFKERDQPILHKKITELENKLKKIFLEMIAYEQYLKKLKKDNDLVENEMLEEAKELKDILQNELVKLNEDKKKLFSSQETNKALLESTIKQLKKEKESLQSQIGYLEGRVIDLEKQVGKY